MTCHRGSRRGPLSATCSRGFPLDARSAARWPRGAWGLGLLVLCLAFCACSPSPPDDPPRRAARAFCDLYFEAADLMAVLPFVTGEARTRVLAEMSRLPAGAAGAPRPAVRATLVQEFRDTASGPISYRAEVLVAPPVEAAPGTQLRTVAFTLVVVPGQGSRGKPWRVSFFQAG